ncbi:MAG: hypothetical protein NZ730_06680 [Porticoccaceae bacterium]|nr:hypothetical protein [Porticoccaceae bacterium]
MLEEQAVVDESATATTPDTLLDASNPELSEGEYFLTEGVKGTGDLPEWYKGDKYKSVAEQAKAYNELEKKFGAFTGAPKDGYSLAEGIEKDDALAEELISFANESNMDQKTFDKAWELLTAQSSAAEEVDTQNELGKLGDNAQERIKTVEGFLKNNLDSETYEATRDLVTSAESIQLVETLVHALAPKKLPIEGGMHPTGLTWADVEQEMFKKDENGRLLRSVDPNHESKIQGMMATFGG